MIEETTSTTKTPHTIKTSQTQIQQQQQFIKILEGDSIDRRDSILLTKGRKKQGKNKQTMETNTEHSLAPPPRPSLKRPTIDEGDDEPFDSRSVVVCRYLLHKYDEGDDNDSSSKDESDEEEDDMPYGNKDMSVAVDVINRHQHHTRDYRHYDDHQHRHGKKHHHGKHGGGCTNSSYDSLSTYSTASSSGCDYLSLSGHHNCFDFMMDDQHHHQQYPPPPIRNIILKKKSNKKELVNRIARSVVSSLIGSGTTGTGSSTSSHHHNRHKQQRRDTTSSGGEFDRDGAKVISSKTMRLRQW